MALRKPSSATTILYVLFSAAIVWQLVGFGLIKSLGAPSVPYNVTHPTIILLLLLLPLFINVIQSKVEPISMSLAIMAVSLMLTPLYYVSIPLIAVSGILGGLPSISSISATFVLEYFPLLVIENAIRAELAPWTPFLFGQLNGLTTWPVPALSTLNIFQSSFSPPTSPKSGSFIKFVGSPIQFLPLAVPVLIFVMVFSFSAFIAGLSGSVLERIKAFETIERFLKVLSPMLVSFVTPVVFVILLIALQGELGGYTTTLGEGAGWVIAVSLIFGGAFTGRELFVQRLERVELLRKQLQRIIGQVKAGISEARSAVSKVSRAVDVSEDLRRTDEVEVMLTTIEKTLDKASYSSLTGWIKDVKTTMPIIEGIPEKIRVRLVDELDTIAAIMSTYNASLGEAQIEERFPELRIQPDISIELALKTYDSSLREIRRTCGSLYSRYREIAGGFNVLAGYAALAPSVDPIAVFDSGDYSQAMRLIANDYYLNFHSVYREQVSRWVEQLRGSLAIIELPLEKLLGRKVVLSGKITKERPIDSSLMLNEVKDILQELDSFLHQTLGKGERLNAMVGRSAISQMVQIASESRLSALRLLEEELAQLQGSPSVNGVLQFLDKCKSSLSDYAEAKRLDESKLIVIAQYPLAKKAINALLKSKKLVDIHELPFHTDAAHVFAEMYSRENHNIGVRYRAEQEELVVEDA